MGKELILPTQNCLVIVNTTLDSKNVVSLDAVLVLEELLHLVELAIIDYIHFEFDFQFEWVVGIVLYQLGFVEVDLLVSLVQKVVEFVTELVSLLTHLFGDVVAVTVHTFLVGLAGRLARDVEVTRGTLNTDEISVCHRLRREVTMLLGRRTVIGVFAGELFVLKLWWRSS